jgi:hypothetical protein
LLSAVQRTSSSPGCSADRVFDYARDDYLREERYDAILDNCGGRSLRKLRRAVAPGGVVVLNRGHDLSFIVADFAARLFFRPRGVKQLSRRSLAPTWSNSLRSEDASVTPVVDAYTGLLRRRLLRHNRGGLCRSTARHKNHVGCKRLASTWLPLRCDRVPSKCTAAAENCPGTCV